MLPEVSSRRIWWAVTAPFLLNGTLYGVWASRIPALQDRLDINHGQLGFLLLGLAGGAICGFPLAGRAVDRFGAVTATRVAAVLFCGVMIILPWMPGYASVLVTLMLFGAFHGALDVAMNAWAAEAETRHDKRWMPSFHAMFSLGAGVGALTGYFAADMGVDMRWHFLVTAGGFGALALWVAKLPWTNATSDSHGQIFHMPEGVVLFAGLCAFCTAVGEGGAADWSAVYLRDIAQATEAQAALGYASCATAMVLLRFAGAPVIAALGVVNVVRLSGISAAAGVALVIAVPTFTAGLIGYFLMGLGYALVFPLAFSSAANNGKIPPGRAIAGVATLGYGGLLLGPPVIGGVTYLTNLPTAFGVFLVLALVLIALAPTLRTS